MSVRFPRRSSAAQLLPWLLLGFSGGPGSAQTPAPDDPLPVVERTLENGMRVQVLERRGAPTVAFVVTYRVGGVNESPGYTGIAHLLEHMLFKGSTSVGTRSLEEELRLFPRIDAVHDSLVAAESDPQVLAPERNRLRAALRRLEDQARQYVEPNEFSRVLNSHGARGLNATTTSESTTYYVELPANRVKLWMILEADRMRNPIFREFYRERDVVLEERRLRVEGDPDGTLQETFLRTAFTEHPYGQPVVGTREDVERLSRPEVERYYRTYYGARNAVVTIVGDVDRNRVLDWAEEYLTLVPAGELPPPVQVVEPPQTEERRVQVTFDAEPRLRMGWHVPEATHPDAPAVFMTSTLLTGGRTARLYRRLVVQERAVTSVHASVGPGGTYPTLLSVTAFPRTGVPVDSIEASIDREIAALAAEPPDEIELERVRNQLEASRVRRLVSNLGLAFQLSEATAQYGDWRASFRILERIQAVRPEDVQRVARTYLTPAKRTVAWVARPDSASPAVRPFRGTRAPRQAYAPAGDTVDGWSRPLPPGAPDIGLEAADEFRPGPLRFRPSEVRKRSVAGVTVIHAVDPDLPLVNVLFRVRGGYGLYPRDAYGALNALPAMMRNGGTEALPPDSVEQLMEYYAIQSSFGGGGEAVVTSFNVLERHLDLALDLWRQLLLQPRFDTTRIEIWRNQELDNLRRRLDSPVRTAYSRFNTLMYGDHPIGWQLRPEDLDAEDLRPGVLRRYHGEIVCRDHLTLGVAGSVEWTEVEPKLEAFLDGWPACDTDIPRGPDPVTRAEGGVFLIPSTSEQAVIVMGQPSGVRQADSNPYVASRIANAILGASGFSSRLFQRVRTEAGYAYSAASVWTARARADGLLGAVTQTSPEQVVPAVQLILDVMGEFDRDGPTSDEVRSAVDESVNGYVFGFQSAGQMVSRRMALEGQSLPVDWPERYLEMVQELNRADVHRVFRRTFDPSRMTVLIVGDPERIGPALADLGPVEILPAAVPVRETAAPVPSGEPPPRP